jgi:hypothetical protein
MSDKLLVATRKGLFTVSRNHADWEIGAVDFLGDNVSIALSDPRDGRCYAALDHGHFGVKLHRSAATGWEEIAAPVYPPKPDGCEEYDMWGRPLQWSTARIWALGAGGPDEPGVIWCGTQPGGLFRSTDRGDSWQMIRTLWDHPRRKQWMGVERTCLASIRSAWTHAIPSAYGSRFRPVASGLPRTEERVGHRAGKG